jgi:DNA-binding NarL/FixJ family response regulator
MKSKIRVLVADDHDLIRRGVRELFRPGTDCQVCGEASSADDAVDKAARLHPDVVVLDVNMPGMPAPQAVKHIRAVSPGSEIVVLTLDESPLMMTQMFREDVRGYVFKSDVDGDLLAAVESAARHEPYFTSKVSQKMYEEIIKGRARRSVDMLHETPLTGRQREVLRLIAGGMSNKEAAAALGITERTVEAHRASMMRKLGMRSFSELVRYAVREKVVEG